LDGDNGEEDTPEKGQKEKDQKVENEKAQSANERFEARPQDDEKICAEEKNFEARRSFPWFTR
jgi:hypothetical protein